jgi:SAM-dependent methyltransferase
MIARAAQSLRLRSLDLADRVTGRSDPLVPPRRMGYSGDSDFRATGDEFLGHFVALAGLQPHERVLDVGCGVGRMARPLAGYLRPPGSYEGFDVVPEGIEWCRRRYAGAHPGFRFRLAEVANGLYRPDGAVPASEYRFPYPDASFDFAFATSVFTHLLPGDADHYIAEIARVLRPGGRVLLTFFLLAGEHDGRPATGRFSFAHRLGPCAVDDPAEPEAAVAYEPAWVRDRLAASALTPTGPVRHGTWSGRPDGLSLQDVVVARRA